MKKVEARTWGIFYHCSSQWLDCLYPDSSVNGRIFLPWTALLRWAMLYGHWQRSSPVPHRVPWAEARRLRIYFHSAIWRSKWPSRVPVLPWFKTLLPLCSVSLVYRSCCSCSCPRSWSLLSGLFICLSLLVPYPRTVWNSAPNTMSHLTPR